ncbi:hypothetical protein [Ensifer sp.]|jgi:TolB-like protein|uniref:hypothetical protein n=1 Tax=Ensifer sp. TaxID=1872086 RepID=UPI002E1595ED|nr:hypothetical protein [Ensifer sp.]
MAVEQEKDVGCERASQPPSNAEILVQLDRIRRSAEFDAPDRDRKFLAYVIEETLAGRGDRIKAYSIATEVFGRDSSFDPQTDPAVRIEAGRIRRALERYYLVAGRTDPIVISIPKGAYVPTFTRRPALPLQADATGMTGHLRVRRVTWLGAAAALCLAGGLAASTVFHAGRDDTVTRHALPKVPRLLVKPFEDLTGTAQSAMMVRGLTGEVADAIARFKEVVVVTPEDPHGPQRVQDDPTFTLAGRVQMDGDRLRLGVRLIQRSDGAVVWADTYEQALKGRAIIDLQAQTGQAVASDVAQPHGALFQASARAFSHAVAGEWQAYACTLAYYDHRDDVSPEGRAIATDCLERTVSRFPTYASGWALLSMTYVDAFRFHPDPAPSAGLERAAEAAARAVKLDPRDPRALEAQMLALFFQGEVDAALKAGARAHAINPADAELAGEYGLRLALSGQWDPGCALVVAVAERDFGSRGSVEAARAVCSYFGGDYRAAEQWAHVAGPRPAPMDHLMLLATLGKLGKTAQAQKQRDWLEANAPGFLETVRRGTVPGLRRSEDQEQLFDGLRKAGLAIAETAYEQARGGGSVR